MADYSRVCAPACKDGDGELFSDGPLNLQPRPRKIYIVTTLSALSGLLLCGLGVHIARSGFAMKAAANIVNSEHLMENLQVKTASNAATLMLDATVRDFQAFWVVPWGHPDFEINLSICCHGHQWGGAIKNLVEKKLGQDGKPVFKGGHTLSNKANFDQWFNDDDLKNKRVPIKVKMVQQEGNKYVADYIPYFPIDGKGWNDHWKYHGPSNDHNFWFTLELHHPFIFHGDETFLFKGDDDLWVFINGELVIDVGGIHGPIEQTVKLNDLGLIPNQFYSLDVFYAERHTLGSNFHVETTINLGEDICAAHHYFQLMQTVHKNLGGLGPDQGSHSLILKALEERPGKSSRSTQLNISVKEGSTFQPSDTDFLFGHFGRIGIKAGTEVTLIIAFPDADKQSELDITFFDLDQGVAGLSSEYIEVGGFTKMKMMPPDKTELQVSIGKDQKTRFSASTPGSTFDNPNNDAFLSFQQKKRAVELSFEEVEMIEVTMGCSAGTLDCDFLFKAKPALTCLASPGPDEPIPESKPNPTPTTTTTSPETVEFCLIDMFGIKLGCWPEKQWWMFWK